MRFWTNGDAGWLAIPVIVLIGVVYIAVVSWALGKSQAARLRQEHLDKAA